ncbi:MAG: DUF58 domain-containing protein [Myxococcales bacterium]|nr:DUF58 domain-containing protein [Myxococcales bacterium]
MPVEGADTLSPRELLRKVRRIEILTRRLVQDQLAGSYHSVFKGRGMSFDEVRPYQPGDEIRLIDWNVTARTGELHVKQFVEERELTVVIALDTSSSMMTGSGSSVRREMAAELAATVALSAIHNSDRVGLLLFSDTVGKFVPPKKTRGHGLRIIREVLGAATEKGRKTDLSAALAYLGLILKRRSVVFLISDFLDVSAIDKEVRALAQRHDVIPLHIRDPLDLNPHSLGATLAEDPESGVRAILPMGFSSYRKAFVDAVQAQIEEVETLFRRAGAQVVSVNLDENPTRPLLQYFKLRAKRH